VLPAERFGPVEKAADSSQSPELRKTAADAAAASADDVSMQVLHVLSQRPSRTGSGITLDALVRHAADDGHEQYVVCGVPADDPEPEIGGLPAERILPLRFEDPLPGMSDVMPYPSTRFSSLSESDVEAYEARWRELLVGLRDRGDIQPDVIHSHHVWLLSALLKDVFPDTPILTHCHATGLRQMELCPHLRERVVTGVGRNERFAALTELHAEKLIDTLDIDSSRVHVVGAGFREDLFPLRRPPREPPRRLCRQVRRRQRSTLAPRRCRKPEPRTARRRRGRRALRRAHAHDAQRRAPRPPRPGWPR
jgi:hypothetical protein